MKKMIMAALIAVFGLAASADAQSTTKKVTTGVKKGAKKVGNKTAELATKGKAKVTDETVDGKVAPNGEKVYVDDGNRYFWVDKRGKRHFVPYESLKDAPKKND